jgi:hypothetical protein
MRATGEAGRSKGTTVVAGGTGAAMTCLSAVLGSVLDEVFDWQPPRHSNPITT